MKKFDFDNLTPESLADHLAMIQASERKKVLSPKKKPKHLTKLKAKGVGGKKPLLARPPKLVDLNLIQVEVDLRAPHMVNGIGYGPGRVRCSAALGNQLLAQDQSAVHYDMHWKDERAVLIGPASKPRARRAMMK